MTIIVTGGAGFIGSNFVFHMLDKYPDYRIICVDKLTYAGNLSTLAPVMLKWFTLPQTMCLTDRGQNRGYQTVLTTNH